MPYSAYRDVAKTQKIQAKDTTIADANSIFYCKTHGCNARMTLVNCADSERAYFRRIPSGAQHSSIFCSADGLFDPTQYVENKFDFDTLFKNLTNETSVSNKYSKRTGAIVSGGGGKKVISTVYQIYLICRKYESYNGYCTDDILVDERNFAKNKNGIIGRKIVQCTPYHELQSNFSYKMNYPSFPYQNGKHIKIKFDNEKLFYYFYKKFKSTTHKELVIVLGDWKIPEGINGTLISECTIHSKRQVHFLKFNGPCK
jgi:hypothetical protein